MGALTKKAKQSLQKAKIVTIRSFVALICVAIGLLITAQWRSIPDRVTNPIAPYTSLKQTKEDLYTEQDQLKNEIKDLQQSLEKTQKDAQDVTLTKDEIAELRLKKAQVGLTKLNGPGVIINLDDSKTTNVSEDSIIHAADLRDIVNLLWGSGAEAISINGQRVVIDTAIDCIVNTILVNNVRLSTPFRIEAIGNQNQMYEIITNKNMLTNLYQRKKEQGIIFGVSKNNDITVPIFDGSFEIKNGTSS